MGTPCNISVEFSGKQASRSSIALFVEAHVELPRVASELELSEKQKRCRVRQPSENGERCSDAGHSMRRVN